jgi:hypothetical protein
MNIWKWFGLNTRETRVELNKQNQVSSVITAGIWCAGLVVAAYFIWG